MSTRLFLVLLLLLHPIRGVLAAGPESRAIAPVQGAGDSCSSDGCCPLCIEIDACPCASDPTQDRDPAPVVPPTTNDAPRLIAAGGAWSVRSDGAPRAPSPGIAGARAPPAVAMSVNDFLSIVCVWTT